MKELSLEERLEQMKESTDPYERGMVKGIAIAMKAYETKMTPALTRATGAGKKILHGHYSPGMGGKSRWRVYMN